MGFLKEFKEFAVRGNVVDLAIDVITGAAFGTTISSLVADVITPLLLTPTLKAAQVGKLDALIWNGVAYSKFLTAAINFLFVAFVLFIPTKGTDKLRKKQEETPAAPAGPTQEELLAEIRDLSKNK